MARNVLPPAPPVPLPAPLARALGGILFRQSQGDHDRSGSIRAWASHAYQRPTNTYDSLYAVPFYQRGGETGIGTETRTGTSVRFAERVYVLLRVIGVREVRYKLFTYSKVTQIGAHVLVLPGVMDTAARGKALLRLLRATVPYPSHPPLRAPKLDDDNAPPRRAERTTLRSAALYTHEDLRALLALHRDPTVPAYTERSAKSVLLRALERHPIAEGNPGDHRAPTSFRADRRQPHRVIETIDFFGGDRLHVRELTSSMVVDHAQPAANGIARGILRGVFGTASHISPESIASLLQRSRVAVEAYLNDPQKLAVVAYLPRSHQTVRRLDRRERHDRILGVALFTFVPGGSRGPTRPHEPPGEVRVASYTHVRLDALIVDGAIDETRQRRTSRRNEAYGAFANFARAAMQYALHVGGDHDIVYARPHEYNLTTWLRRRAASVHQLGMPHNDRALPRMLRRCGFKRLDATTAIGRDYARAAASPTSAFLRSTNPFTDTVLVYSALTVVCTTGKWRECVQRVRALHPEKRFAEQLKIAQTYYTPKHPRPSQPGTATTLPRRSKRAVSVTVGARLLQAYYLEKFLGRTSLQAADVHDPDAVRKCCSAIRHHLDRTRKTQPVLALDSGKTWLFRTPPHVPITPQKKHGGPDSYYLEGLDAQSEAGAKLYAHPLGKRFTPLAQVKPPPALPRAA